jgi:diguanylate cyclase (GGDEF)-like protein
MGTGTNRPEEIDPGGVRKLLYLLDSLRTSPAGSLIYRQAEGMLGDVAANQLRAELAYSGFVHVLLEAFNAHQTPGSPPYVQIKLLQARLQPPLTPTELDTLGVFIEQCGEQIRGSSALEPSLLMEAISPLLAAFGIDTPAATPSTLEEVESIAGDVTRHAATAVPPHRDRTEVDYGEEPEDDFESEAEDDDFQDEEIAAAQDLNGIDRSELEARRDQLQATLGQQVLETITQNEEFGVILEMALSELRQAEDLTELENLRWTLIREVEKLMKGHNELADKLDSTHHYLRLFETDSRELSDELTRVRLLSLTDELTSLPNRRAFMRRMEDEVARVQRYGFPLSFILIDLDHFKAVNDELGHAAGDEVLRVYSKNILSIFRHHDMVARYGGEEFAVLLPNTDSDGAVRALNKVRRRASETRWQVNGTVSKVPTFSAGVSLYKPGESASAFIERADKALYRAKHLGRNRIELDITYQNGGVGGVPRRRSTDT